MASGLGVSAPRNALSLTGMFVALALLLGFTPFV
jgi:hypothetical protein